MCNTCRDVSLSPRTLTEAPCGEVRRGSVYGLFSVGTKSAAPEALAAERRAGRPRGPQPTGPLVAQRALSDVFSLLA